MIPKKEEPAAKDHRPITCLNTLYKAITSVIDELLKEHEAAHQLRQIDQKGCKQGSMGCIDNLLMDKAILEDAQFNRKPNQTTSQQRSNLATQDFEQFWRPIWETAPSENLESRWIKEIGSIL